MISTGELLDPFQRVTVPFGSVPVRNFTGTSLTWPCLLIGKTQISRSQWPGGTAVLPPGHLGILAGGPCSSGLASALSPSLLQQTGAAGHLVGVAGVRPDLIMHSSSGEH